MFETKMIELTSGATHAKRHFVETLSKESAMNLICKLMGHKSKQYLQVSETPVTGEWIDSGKKVTKKIHTYFLCSRCHHRFRQSEIYYTEEKIEDEKKDNKEVKSKKDTETSKDRKAHLKAVPSCSQGGHGEAS